MTFSNGKPRDGFRGVERFFQVKRRRLDVQVLRGTGSDERLLRRRIRKRSLRDV